MTSRRQLRLTIATALLGAIARPVHGGTISDELQAQMDAAPATQRIPVIIPMSTQVDPVATAGSLKDKAQRLPVLVDALKTMAASTQNAHACGEQGLLDQLAAAGATKAANITQLWAINAVAVEATKDVITTASLRSNVGELGFAGTRTVEDPGSTTSTPQWNITKVRAPEAWTLGFTGGGTAPGLVATIDTGGNLAHPVISANVLRDAGNNPIWLDTVSPGSAPNDPDGHGTHVLGVAVGQSGYGVAPDAKWMACRAFTRVGATLETTAARMLQCAQWVLNPDHPGVSDPGAADPTHVPDAVMADLVISAAGFCDPFLQSIVRVWRAARIVPVFSVGDDPIQAPVGAVPSPANDPLVVSVGAADANDAILPTTYRGIAFCHPPTEPDGTAPHLVAPGVNVSSAWTGTSYATRSGSDVAAAHVAGAVALVRAAHPDLRKVSVDFLDQKLIETAAAVSSGQHRLDVYSAVTLEDAEAAGVAPPPSPMNTGDPAPVVVTFHNVGLTTWTTGQYELRFASGPSPWTAGNIPLPQVDNGVLPDETVNFVFTATAPMTPGTYAFQWTLCHVGGSCFGDLSTPTTPIVVNGVDRATYVTQGVDCTAPAVSGSAWVLYKNTGTTTWSNPSYIASRLGNYGPASMSICAPGGAGIVPPGQFAQFCGSFSGPYPAGYYSFAMRPKHNTTPFGDTSPTVVIDTNDCSTKNDNLNTGTVHTELRVGQTWGVVLSFTNTGQSTWRAGYCVKLIQGSWGSSAAQVCLTGTQTVVPGGTWVTPAIPVVAPNNPGRWPIAYQMYTDDNAPFGQVWSGTIGIPRDHQASVEWSSVQGTYNWFYRYYSTADVGWDKMTWTGGNHWKGTQNYQEIWQNYVHPGGTNGSARFWKSPIDGTIRASATLQDLDGSCGEGIRFRLRKNKGLLFEWDLPNGFGPTPFSVEIPVQKDDTIRFIVGPDANNSCDSTLLDPLIQVLPPVAPATGPAPSEGYVVGNAVVEPGGD